ncbi:MAG: VacJ family lipoprotein [Porticoccaceae bacterium]|nr:VacJ family lipoprotein [Porticoccaceae bacterium]
MTNKSLAAVALLISGLVSGLMAMPVFADDGDQFEALNRKMFYVNERLDHYALRPAAVTYTTLMPDPLEKGIENFFSNLDEVGNVFNDLLQGKFKQAGHDSGRFLINTTIGLGGLFDVAKRAGLDKSDGEDFGQTLAVWGVGEGPYLMLPLIGPSTLRDAPSKFVDSITSPFSYVDDVPARNTARGVDLLTKRVSLLELDDVISGDKYLFVRDVYLQRNRYLVNDGAIEDDFGDFEDY